MKDIKHPKIAYIYIDESGTPTLEIEKKGVMPFEVYSAVVIEKDNIVQARESLNEIIIENNIKRGYLKSSKMSDDQRIKVLSSFNKFAHHVLTLVIDKSKINKESGLQYKKSFVKYFQRILSKKFFERYDEFHIWSDSYGNTDFRLSLTRYLEDKGYIGQTLFSNNTFIIADDQNEEPLLQFADIYAGTVAKYFCHKYSDDKLAKYIYENFISKKVTIEWFPWETITLHAAQNIFNDKFDIDLYNIALETANKYIINHEHDDIEGVELIKYIIQESKYHPLRVISSKEIKQKLNSLGYEISDPINKIALLRTEEVVIISPQGKKGYKFPTSEQELADFYDRLRDNVIPQLLRCRTINNVLQEKSFGKYGVLKTQEYKKLNILCEVAYNTDMV